jgi:hypothetical protein
MPSNHFVFTPSPGTTITTTTTTITITITARQVTKGFQLFIGERERQDRSARSMMNHPHTTPSSLFAPDESDSVPTLGGGGGDSGSGGGGGGGHGMSTITSSMMMDIDHQSPLERLIAQSTSEQRGDTVFHIPPPPRQDNDDGGGGGECDDSEYFVLHNLNNPNGNNRAGSAISVLNDNIYDGNDGTPSSAFPSLVTLIAGTLCLLQVAFIWASYLSSSWFDTHLIVSLALPLIKTNTDQVLHTTTLASLLSALLGAEEHWAATFLIVTSLIVPCLSCVCNLAWTMGDHETRKEKYREQWAGQSRRHQQQQQRWHHPNSSSQQQQRRNGGGSGDDSSWMSPRLFLEWAMRVSLTVFFLLCVLDVGTSSIEIDSNSTQFVVNNRIQSGLACFAIGISCSVSVVMLLRMAKISFISENGTHGNGTGRWQYQPLQNYPLTSSGTAPVAISDPIATTSAPPHRAFQLPWNIRGSNTSERTMVTIQEQQPEHQELHTPLLLGSQSGQPQLSDGLWNDDMTVPTANTNRHNMPLLLQQQQRFPNRIDIDPMQLETSSMPPGNDDLPMPFWKRAIIYELAAASTVLWLPALFFPLFELTYTGIISEFMPEVSFSVQYWELPAVLWQRGIAAGTARWVLTVLGTVLVFFVYVCPMLATLLAIATWRLDLTESTYCRNVLRIIHPSVCGIIFVLAVQLAIPAFQAIGEFAIDTGSSGLCQKFEVVTSDTCMTIVGEPRIGLWFLWAQTISLEVFIALTFVWRHR